MRLRPNILRPQRGLFIGGQSIPLPDLFDYSTRSGLNLVDALGGSNATIIGGKVASFTSGQNYYQQTKYVGLPYIETCFYITQSDNNYFWVVENGATWAVDRLCQVIKDLNNKISFYVFGSNGTPYILSSTNTYLQYSSGCLKAWYDGNKLYLQIYSLAGDLLENKESTIGAITLRTATNDRITIGSPQKLPMQGYLWNTIYKNNGVEVLKYAGNHLYNSITGVAATNNGVTFPLITTATPQSTTDALTDGYFQLSGGQQVVKPQFTLPVGAVNHVGGQVHNLISSFVTFPAGSSMDRSNTTIFNATCRASIYYDSSNPRRWHVSELNYDTMQTYLEAAYTNTRFASIKTNYLNQLYIDRFFAFAAPISGKTLTYYLTLIGK